MNKQQHLRSYRCGSPVKAPHMQAGAAMVEFTIAGLFFLIPLYLAAQALGKFADVQHMTQAGARYAAWERTVWLNDPGTVFYKHNRPNEKSDQEMRREIRVRLFNDRSSQLLYKDEDKKEPKKNPNKKDTPEKLTLDPLWTDTNGKPFLSDYDKQTSMNASSGKPTWDLLGEALSLISKVSIPHVTGSLIPPVPTQNMVVTNFALKDVAKDSETYKRLWDIAYLSEPGSKKNKDEPKEWPGISTKAQAAVLTNAWNANARDGTKAMVAESVPTAQTAMKSVVGPVFKVGVKAWQPTLIATGLVGWQEIDVGRIGTDVVPPDRLR